MKREIYEQFQSFINGATVSIKVRRFGSLSAGREIYGDLFCGNVCSRERGALFTQQICTQFFARVRKNNYGRICTVAHTHVLLHAFMQDPFPSWLSRRAYIAQESYPFDEVSSESYTK